MKKLFLIPFAQVLAFFSFAQTTVQNLRCENLTNPIGLDVQQPRFSWQLASPKRGVMQTAYELRLGRSASLNGKDLVWSTGKIASDSSVLVTYKGSPLQAEQRYYWQVRIWDGGGKTSDWSAPASFQMAFLQPADWKASWIEPGYTEDSVMRPSPLLRKEFNVGKKIKSATAYITAHGLYEAYLNGKRIGDAYLTPGWTSYNKRLQYQVYDVTGLVKQGANAVGAELGSGWYRGNLAWGNNLNIYGKDIALLFQLQLEYTDGTKESIVSDGSWKSATGSIRFSEIYHGETIDNNLEKAGWTTAGYNDQNWSGIKVTEHPKNILVATYNEPVKKHETFKPVRKFTTPAGDQVLDFGQNLVGWVITKATGKAGDKIVLSHAEVMDKRGNFYIDNLRKARARDTFVLSGKGQETFEPHFTWHGFRFVKVEGYPGEINPDNFTAVALYSDMKPTGSFTSSNALINQLQHNIEWGLRGNFLDVPTDCPQRDERLGWTGDAQVFSRTATFLRDADNFFAKWMKDVSADQFPSGSVPHVIPNVLGNGGGSAGWSDVACVIPWNLYLAYGDKRVLEDQYPSMKAWVGYMKQQSTANLWNKGSHFGDWLFYSINDDNDGSSAITNKYLIAQCFWAHSTQLLINAARVLGYTADVATYTALLKDIKTAFVNEYITFNGASMSNTQTSYVLALMFDMLPEEKRAQAAARLVANINLYRNHLTTGFLGTPYLCHVLSRYGYNDMAYTLLLQDSYPSWLYPVKMGATTIWERWNGIHPDSSFETPTMNSYNHYAYGAIGDWMYRVAAGIDTDPDGVGYKKIIIKPHVGGRFTQLAASYLTRYGKVSSGWKIENNKLVMDVEIPANTTATVYIPAASADSIQEGGKQLAGIPDIKVGGQEDGWTEVKLGSGKYQFTTGRREEKQPARTASRE
ncbi:MAG: glycoside hydrolase family 78 protein [Williamsia sp.]|nr:glycoside hydrolase family 78 protein [Williamsia sp.]